MQRVVDCREIDLFFLGRRRRIFALLLQDRVEIDMRRTIAALRGRAAARVVHENPPHHLRGEAVELRATFPIDLLLVDHAQERFVNECRALQCVRVALVTQMTSRHRP